MGRFLTVIMLLGGLLVGPAQALDFEITSVIPVETSFAGGMIGPAQWSPDGTQLAYFSQGHLVISDTLGNSHLAAEIDLPPHRFVWSSDSSILLFQRELQPGRTYLYRMSTVNTRTGAQTVLEEFHHQMAAPDPPRIFKGPYLTIEGNAYYRVEEEGVETIQMAPGLTQDKGSLQHNHILRTGTDVLYLVKADFMDSVKVSNKPYKPYMPPPMNLSPDQSHIMIGGVIVRLTDDEMILLDTLIEKFPRPEGTTECGFGSESFNPIYTEVAFRLSCDDGESYIFRRIGVFDYTTYQFTILDTLIGLSNCTRPAYAPDGKRISFISDGVLYIMNRELNHDEDNN